MKEGDAGPLRGLEELRERAGDLRRKDLRDEDTRERAGSDRQGSGPRAKAPQPSPEAHPERPAGSAPRRRTGGGEVFLFEGFERPPGPKIRVEADRQGAGGERPAKGAADALDAGARPGVARVGKV